jgi:hypothetical protein
MANIFKPVNKKTKRDVASSEKTRAKTLEALNESFNFAAFYPAYDKKGNFKGIEQVIVGEWEMHQIMHLGSSLADTSNMLADQLIKNIPKLRK